MYTTYPITLTLAGATGNVDSPRNYSGRVVAIGIKYTGVPGTTVVTITTKGTAWGGSFAYTLLVTPASNTNTWYFPQQATVLTTTGAAIANWYVDPEIDDFLNVAAASSGAGTIQVSLIIENA